MSESKENTGGGILKGIKKLLFSDPQQNNATEPEKGKNAPATTQIPTPSPIVNPELVDQDAKLKVYQLLEGLNIPGCDFFEVWNAAVEMGGANVANIKSAYTSLRYADLSLNKSKLEETGNFYISEISKILSHETGKRRSEMEKIEAQRLHSKTVLTQEVMQMEAELTSLQEKLAKKKEELAQIQDAVDPQVAAINQRILQGEASVNSVILEMKDVLNIIAKEIN